MTRDRIMLAGVSLLVALALAEVVLALAAPQIHHLPNVWTHDPDLGWFHRPGSRGRLVTPEFSVAYRIDAEGLRQHPAVTAAAGARGRPQARVQVYGDSFAEGWGVEVEQTLAARLEAGWHRMGRAARVENFGVAGYGTDQEFLLYQGRGASRHPNLVVLLFYANDLWNNISRHGIGTQRGAKPYYRPDADGRLWLHGVPVPAPPPRPAPGLDQWLAEHLNLWALVRQVGRSVPGYSSEVVRYYRGLYAPEAAKGRRYRPLWELTGRLVERFHRRVQADGAHFVLVYAPAIVQVEAEDWRTKRELHELTGDYDLDQPGRILAAMAQRQGLQYLDLTTAFRSAAEDGADLYYDESHWTPAGHELAARILVGFLGDPGGTEAVSPGDD